LKIKEIIQANFYYKFGITFVYPKSEAGKQINGDGFMGYRTFSYLNKSIMTLFVLPGQTLLILYRPPLKQRGCEISRL
jgi:hypothetical protein